jgi:CHAT domain-containing protein
MGLSSPEVLHISTHGFFLGKGSSLAGTREVRDPDLPGRPELPTGTESMLRSGLVFAGAKTREGPQTLRNSVVTGLELASLDLWGTQLVVLAACDTGRGDALPGEGNYGLRRALMIAGAQTLVTSLWSVKDDTTAQLMTAYYRRLRAGDGRVSALQGAMAQLRQRYPHPYYWAPFIAIGQDTPLRLNASSPLGG